jgi:hypothetical protein
MNSFFNHITYVNLQINFSFWDLIDLKIYAVSLIKIKTYKNFL